MAETLPVGSETTAFADDEVIDPSPTLASRIAGIAGYIKSLPRGDQAELRRLGQHVGRIPPEVFWRIVARYKIHHSDEPFWQSVLPLMVKHPHSPNARPGQKLDEARVSPARVERWLRLDKEGARREASRLLSKLDAGVDWVQLGYLLYMWDEKNRTRLARDFFLTRSRRTAQSSTDGGD